MFSSLSGSDVALAQAAFYREAGRLRHHLSWLRNATVLLGDARVQADNFRRTGQLYRMDGRAWRHQTRYVSLRSFSLVVRALESQSARDFSRHGGTRRVF